MFIKAFQMSSTRFTYVFPCNDTIHLKENINYVFRRKVFWYNLSLLKMFVLKKLGNCQNSYFRDNKWQITKVEQTMIKLYRQMFFWYILIVLIYWFPKQHFSFSFCEQQPNEWKIVQSEVLRNCCQLFLLNLNKFRRIS